MIEEDRLDAAARVGPPAVRACCIFAAAVTRASGWLRMPDSEVLGVTCSVSNALDVEPDLLLDGGEMMEPSLHLVRDPDAR